jgi:hypothetical protein
MVSKYCGYSARRACSKVSVVFKVSLSIGFEDAISFVSCTFTFLLVEQLHVKIPKNKNVKTDLFRFMITEN